MHLLHMHQFTGGGILDAVGAVKSTVANRAVSTVTAKYKFLLTSETLQVLLLLLPPHITYGLVEVCNLMPVESRWRSNSNFHELEKSQRL